MSPKGTTSLAALISGRSKGGNYAGKIGSPVHLKHTTSAGDEQYDKLKNGISLSVFKKKTFAKSDAEHNLMHSPPSHRERTAQVKAKQSQRRLEMQRAHERANGFISATKSVTRKAHDADIESDYHSDGDTEEYPQQSGDTQQGALKRDDS